MPLVASAVDSLSNAFAVLSGDPSVKLTGGMKTIADAVGVVINAIKTLLGWLGQAIGKINDLVGAIGKVTGAMTDIPGNIAKVPGGVGDFLSSLVPHFAGGGWAGLNGPELAVVGESGPEYIVPNHALGQGSGSGPATPIIVQVDGKTLFRIMDAHGYLALQRAAPTVVRS